MGRGAGPAPRLAPRAALGLLLALACSAACSAAADTTQAPKDVCPEPPTKELVCYYEGSTPVSRLDACLCTSVVFTDVASKAGDGFAVDIGVRSQVRALRKRNPWVRALLQLQVGAAQLKSEDRRLRASQAVSAALRKATVDGVELDLDWSHHGAANKTHLTAFVKAVRFQLDSADAVDRRRAKRDYEIFERQVEDETTPSWRPTPPALAARRRAATSTALPADTTTDEAVPSTAASAPSTAPGARAPPRRGRGRTRTRPSQSRGGTGGGESSRQPRPPGRTLSGTTGAAEATEPRPRPRGPPHPGAHRQVRLAHARLHAPRHAPPRPDETDPHLFHCSSSIIFCSLSLIIKPAQLRGTGGVCD